MTSWLDGNGSLEAGVARGDITPQAGAVLQGHWGAPPSHSVLRPLEVRAIVFASGDRRAALATVDAIGVTRETTRRIRALVEEACGIPADEVMVVCSHTHCAPPTLPCMGLRPSAAWVERIEQETAACIARAAARRFAVKLGVGGGEAGFNQSRRPAANLDREPADQRVRVLRIDRLDGSMLAAIFHYACHATALTGLRGLISPDYPGIARDHVEGALRTTAMFLPGCGGDLRPALDTIDVDEADAVARLETCGRVLGQEVCRVADRIDTSPARALHGARADVEFPFGDVLPVDRLRELAAEQGDMAWLTGPWARQVLRFVETRSLPRGRATEMQAMTIGPLTLVGIPGEPLQDVGRSLEQDLSGPPASPFIWPVGYANDLIGYFCTAQQHREGGYEPTAYSFFDAPAPFSTEERVILAGARRLLCNRRFDPST
jgi:hypothetical protein